MPTFPVGCHMGALIHRVMVTELKAKRSHGPRWALIERGA